MPHPASLTSRDLKTACVVFDGLGDGREVSNYRNLPIVSGVVPDVLRFMAVAIIPFANNPGKASCA